MDRLPRRASAARIAKALDEIIEMRRLERPYTLYRYVAEQTGVNPTTVLRYHTGYLRSAPAVVNTYVRKLLVLVRGGNALPFESLSRRKRATLCLPPTGRVPASLVRQGLDGLVQSLGLGERQILYRYLAERVGLHPTTVLRYDQSDLQTAPATLVAEIDLLRKRIVAGEAVKFSRGGDGSSVVLRERTRAILEELLREREDRAERTFHVQLDRRLGLPVGTTKRICFEPDLRFVRADVHRAIERFVHGVEYDPGRTFQVGERIRHHLFGPGMVVEKIHKNKVRVEFLDGKQVILAEAAPEDPYRRQRADGSGALMGCGG